MVKRKEDEPADKAAERLKQLLDARRPVPEEKQKDQEPAGKKPEPPAGPEKDQQASDEPKCS
jgi:hypothetical protein